MHIHALLQHIHWPDSIIWGMHYKVTFRAHIDVIHKQYTIYPC